MVFDSRKPVVILRGEQLAHSAGSKACVESFPSNASRASTSPRSDGESVYGIPVSAVQYCCGRGCRHCRVYWNNKKV
jgi:hypothetical protein